MYYVYVLKNNKDDKYYIGFASNLKEGINLHNKGSVESTMFRGPFDLVYYKACVNKYDTLHREKYLKTTYGKRYIRNRIKEHLAKK